MKCDSKFTIVYACALVCGEWRDGAKRVVQLAWRLSDEPVAADEDEDMIPLAARAQVKAKIFLGYTSNMISCGVREIIRFLCQHKLVRAEIQSIAVLESISLTRSDCVEE